MGCGSSSEAVEQPAEQAPAEARALPRASTGPDAIVPLGDYRNYDACLSELQAGASSCGLVDRPHSVERGFAVLVLGGEHLGWFLQTEPAEREGEHRLMVVDPANRRRVTTATFSASLGCAEPFHTDSSSGLAYSDRESLPADATRLVRAHDSEVRDVLEVTVTEAFPVCDPSECDSACQGNTFVHDQVVELALPSG